MPRWAKCKMGVRALRVFGALLQNTNHSPILGEAFFGRSVHPNAF